MYCSYIYHCTWSEEGIADELQDGTGTIWNRILLGVLVVVAVFVFHGIAYIVRLFKKDRLQKTLMNKYVVFHMKMEVVIMEQCV